MVLKLPILSQEAVSVPSVGPSITVTSVSSSETETFSLSGGSSSTVWTGRSQPSPRGVGRPLLPITTEGPSSSGSPSTLFWVVSTTTDSTRRGSTKVGGKPFTPTLERGRI